MPLQPALPPSHFRTPGSRYRRLLPIIIALTILRPLYPQPTSLHILLDKIPHEMTAMKTQHLLKAVPSPSAVSPLACPNCASFEAVFEGDIYSPYSVLHLFRGPIGL